MSANPWQAFNINANLIYDGDSVTPITSGVLASEIPLVNDNINRNLSNYSQIMGCWNGYTFGISSGYQSEASRNAGTWWQPHGYEYNWAARARGGYHSRIVSFNDEVSRFGYISSMVAGYWAANVVHDQVDDNNISYETPYGHGAASWPIPATDQAKTQFRDATSLPSDGASRLILTGSSWNRSPYLHPTYYAAHIVNGGALSTGAVSFMVEQRPSWRMVQQGGADSTHQSHAYYPSAFFPDVPLADTKVQIAMSWLAGHVAGQGTVLTYNAGTWGAPDGAWAISQLPMLRTFDPRYRQAAVTVINEEYYAAIWGSLLMIFSTKMSYRPIYLYDFAVTAWAASTHQRIAGIAVDGLNLWVLSESGDLALVDFSVSGGQVLPKAAATAVTGEERYGALVKQGTKLWALVGSYCEHTLYSTTTATLGVRPYTISSNTWGARTNSAVAARQNIRAINEMIALADGRLAALVEDVSNTVAAPANLYVPGATAGGSTYNGGFPENQTIVTKIPGSMIPLPGALNRIKIGFSPTYGKLQATIKWLPKGSPAGTAFTGSAQCLFGGQLTGTLGTNIGGALNLTSDWVTLPWDPTTYDYYLYSYFIDGTYGATVYYTPWGNGVGGNYYTPGIYCALAAGDTQADAVAPSCGLYSLGALYGIYTDGVDTFIGYNNVGLPATNWQVMVFNPTGTAWNTTKITTTTFSYGNLGSSYKALANAPFFSEVSANKLLVQGNYNITKTFLVDVSGTLDPTAIKDVSWGQAQTIYSTGMNMNGADAVFLENVVDSSIACFLQTYYNSYDWNYNCSPIGTARPDFVWDGTEQMSFLGGNPYSAGAVQSIAKDGIYPTNVQNNSGMYGSGYSRELSFPVHYADNQMTIMHLGSYDSTHVSSERFTHGTYYLPRYWKYQGGTWKVAKNFADAWANPYILSATADTAVPVMHGLVFSFGPSTNTTFQSGEFHTVNVTYGQVKFARRTRWDWTMFAGRTFHNTETKSIASLDTLGHRRVPIGVDTPITLSGPTSIAQMIVGAGDNHTITWPVASGGVGNDAPAVVTYDLSKVPTVAPLSVPGAVVTPSPEFAPQWTNAACSIRIDYGVGNAPIIKAYDFGRFGYSDTRAFTNWQFQGSNDASTNPTNWTTIETVSAYVWPTGMDYRVAHAIRDISTNTTGYRHYRILFGAEGWNYPRWASFNLWDVPLGPASFADLMLAPEDNQNGMSGVHYVYGMKFEVNAVAAPDTAGFTEITPKFRAHNGAFYCFDRQQNVRQLRITTKQGAWWNDTTRHLPPVQLWDYASQAAMDALRVGSSVAANNTRERGSFDPECMGVTTDATAIWVDSNSPVMWTPQYLTQYLAYQGWFNFDSKPTPGRFIMHPYYGFIKLPAGTTGTTLHIKYAWGRRA